MDSSNRVHKGDIYFRFHDSPNEKYHRFIEVAKMQMNRQI